MSCAGLSAGTGTRAQRAPALGVSSGFDSEQAPCDLPVTEASVSSGRPGWGCLLSEGCVQGVCSRAKAEPWHCPSTRAGEAPVSSEPSNFITQQAAEIDFASPAVSKGKITFLLDFWLSAN